MGLVLLEATSGERTGSVSTDTGSHVSKVDASDLRTSWYSQVMVRSTGLVGFARTDIVDVAVDLQCLVSTKCEGGRGKSYP